MLQPSMAQQFTENFQPSTCSYFSYLRVCGHGTKPHKQNKLSPVSPTQHKIRFKNHWKLTTLFPFVRFLQRVHHVYTISIKLHNLHCIMEIRTNFHGCFPQINYSALKTECFLFSQEHFIYQNIIC
jgi:hypothetical protein